MEAKTKHTLHSAQAKDQTVLSQFVKKDKAYCFMKNI